MTILLEYLDLVFSDIGQVKTFEQKEFPETLGSPCWYNPVLIKNVAVYTSKKIT